MFQRKKILLNCDYNIPYMIGYVQNIFLLYGNSSVISKIMRSTNALSIVCTQMIANTDIVSQH